MALETSQLTDNLFIIVEKHRGRFPMSHSFLVRDEISALIDTGCGIELLAEIKEAYKIDIIINSHGHPDHSAGNYLFPDAALHVPRMGAETHGRLEPLSRRFFPNETQAQWWRRWIKKTMGFEDREPTDFFDDGQVFDFGHVKLQAIHTPGHTMDHFCFLELNSEVLLTFDIDLTPFGPWYGNLESSLKDFRSAIQKVRDLKPGIIASGHRLPIFKDVSMRIDKYEGVMDRRNQLIKTMLDRGLSRSDIIKSAPIYGHHKYARDILPLFEERMVDLHLEEMEELGMIRIEGEKIHVI
ncbi:MAG: MBL fold metallo-hydrolase [Desulfomonilaceae bacterium]|jgi:glyoxylase-like metal-dependent hydrolase (beta-lactamase superfamily II)